MELRKPIELQPEPFAFAGTGTIYSFTTLTDPPTKDAATKDEATE